MDKIIESTSDCLKDIPLYATWKVIRKIEKGWSEDQKFYILAYDEQQYLLRVSDIKYLQRKEKEYEVMMLWSQQGFHMSNPMAIGTCGHDQYVYLLLTYVQGECLEDILPTLDEKQQYTLGKEAGSILRKIHHTTIPSHMHPAMPLIQKKLTQLALYEASANRVSGDDRVIDYVKTNIQRLSQQKNVLQHGDFHPGNLILTPDNHLGVIDFNRFDIGDPYEEFYKLVMFASQLSPAYCKGQIDAYFDHKIPNDFWEILKLYVAHTILYSIKWAEAYGHKEIENMQNIYHQVMEDYDQFLLLIPKWYQT